MKESKNLKLLLDTMDEHGLYQDINMSITKSENEQKFLILGGIEDYTKLHRLIKSIFKSEDAINMEDLLDVKFAFLKLTY